MVLNPIFLGGAWFIIHRYYVFHTFIWRGWVGGLSQMKLTSFEKNCHILRRSQKKISTIKDFRFGTFPSISCSGSGYTFYRSPLPVAYQGPYKLVLISTKDYNCIKSSIIIIWIRHSLQASIASTYRHVHVQIVVLGSFLHYC